MNNSNLISMSLASDYAATQASADATKVTANQAAPPMLDGPNATLSVTPDGQCLITPKSNTNPVTIPPAQAVAVANWILATFS